MAEHAHADSLTYLLKKKGGKISAVAANKKLLAAGVLTEKERPSTTRPGVIKKYKALTDLGLKYGENVANERAQGETAPQYYTDMFDELYEQYLQD